MVGMKPKEKEEKIAATEKSKTFRTVSAITTATRQDEEQVTQKATVNQDKRIMESKSHSLELCDLMTKLEQRDKKLRCSKEDRHELKKEIRHNKIENLDNYYVLARATEKTYNRWSTR